MSEDITHELALEITQLREQVRSVARNVEEIKTSVGLIARLERTLAELAIHGQNASKEINSIWTRIDEGKKERTQLDARITTTNAAIEAIVNKGRGALWVASIMMGLLQATIVGAVGWAALRIIDSDKAIATQQHRIERLERQSERGTPQPLS